MAVTIDKMHVDAQDNATQTPAPSSTPAAKPAVDMRREMQKHRERELRLEAD